MQSQSQLVPHLHCLRKIVPPVPDENIFWPYILHGTHFSVVVRNIASNHLWYFVGAVSEGLPGQHTKLGGDRLASKLNMICSLSSTQGMLGWPTRPPPPLSSLSSSSLMPSPSLLSSSLFSLPSSSKAWQWWHSHSLWALASQHWSVSLHSCTACLIFSDSQHTWPLESSFFE